MNNRESSSIREPEVLWTRSFVVITCCYFLLFLCLQLLLSPFPSYVKDRFDPGAFTLSLVTGIFAMTAIAARFMTAALMKKMDRNVLLYAGTLIAVLATAAYSFADSVAGVLLLRVCFGIGFGMGSTVMPTIVSQLLPRTRMGEGIGYFGLSTSLAMSVGPMVGLTVLNAYGFPVLTVFGAAAAALILPLLPAARLRSSAPAGGLSAGQPAVEPEPELAAKPKPEVGAKPKKSRFRPGLVLPAFLNMLLSMCYGGILGFLALFGKEAGIGQIGLFFLFNAVTVLAIRPVSGRLYDTRGHGVVLVPAAVSVAASLVVLSMADALPMLIAAALLFGLGFGAIQPTLQAWMLESAPREEHGAVNSLFYNAIDFGVAAGSMLLGVVAASVGYAGMYRVSAGIMAGFLLLYVMGRQALKRRRSAGAVSTAHTELQI